MIRHLFTFIWNRRRANGLLILEIFLAFVVLFVVGGVGVYNWRNYRMPLGFTYENVWQIQFDRGQQEHYAHTLRQIVQRLRSTPGVVSASYSSGNTPFSSSRMMSSIEVGEGSNRRLCRRVNLYSASPELRDVLGLHLREGRWFNRSDEASTSTNYPVVITKMLRDTLFPRGQAAVGQVIGGKTESRHIVGVVEAYRVGGKLSESQPGMFQYVNPRDTALTLTTLLVRVQPGAGGALEKKISDDVRAITRDAPWQTTITPLVEQHLAQLKLTLAMPAALGVVCVFLLLNVALGLFGVLWLNISQRRAEIGVRRAMGATAGAISTQIVGEILVVTTFGLVPGLAVAAQFPLLGVLSVQTNVYLTAMLLATGLIYALSTVCALYPSWLAAGIQPAVALREE